ncbi:unnamed protein product [Macrosiphum euphorbiae]|uniref:Peptidase C1A papain C-terminal domain-containing protein n=1 Tax=Macrosiphum euphorbiae TaxID=13131 RepID=A0AAV0WA14_9HEMI|nr:unnamed protein product [Macrosiphum euphorbiae]
MAKILFLASIMLLSFYLTEQTIISDVGTIMLEVGENVDKNARNPRYVLDTKVHKEFDARKRWPKCKTIGEVLNDGNNLYSWAYANAAIFSDRKCIATNGVFNQFLSTEELISCSGIKAIENGISKGGVDQLRVWEYFKSHGLVSGGKYNTDDGCQPSKILPIGNLPTTLYKPECKNRCYGNKTIDYNHDHSKVSHKYKISYEDIQKEVQNYGPVSVQFFLYYDFYLYRNGVYSKTENSKFVRWQYAKLIGWGVENGVDYWLLVNSWGKEWGQNGLFKIKRGTNECSIETAIYAGEPERK